MDFIYLYADLIKALVASLGGCLLRYLVDYKAGKRMTFPVCLADCGAAVFLGYYSYIYVLEEIGLDIVHSIVLNIIIGYVGADGVNIAKTVVLNKVDAYFKVKGAKDASDNK